MGVGEHGKRERGEFLYLQKCIVKKIKENKRFIGKSDSEREEESQRESVSFHPLV